ncbi:MAG TPA: choice-of-anchor D domain-containing protein [Verrucomicrobiae bacterium]|nr:choice-of-anchor D domain-containing protein [Verrucomicrobiae bacterium]
MKFSVSKLCVLVVLAGVLSMGVRSRATPTMAMHTNKVIVYPTAADSIEQLKQQGITTVWNYGSYWLVEATASQTTELTRLYGARAVMANQLNEIRLRNVSFDTTEQLPSIPASLLQKDVPGKRLRLIQFCGPVIPEWLEQLQSVGNVELLSYVPNNAYLIRVDQAAEDKLRALARPTGPIQWLGAFHPYYKIHPGLINIHPGLVNGEHGEDNPLVDLRIIVVRDSKTNATMHAMEKLGLIQESYPIGNQRIVFMTVPISSVAQMAKLSDVIWIERAEPKRVLDEVQDLVLAGQTNAPGFGPTNTLGGTSATFTNYLDFLLTKVAGTLTNTFIDPTTYPVVDIWDTGLDDGGYDNGNYDNNVAHPCFYYLGRINNGSRVVHIAPPWIAGDPDSQEGCTVRETTDNTKPFYYLEGADLSYSSGSHGTMVASIVAGYDAGTNVLAQPCLQLVGNSNTWLIPFGLGQNVIIDTNTLASVSVTNAISDCAIINGGTETFSIELPTGFANTCGRDGAPPTQTFSNLVYTITTNSCPTNIYATVFYTAIITNFETQLRTDVNGFQLGMGVSPFGLISADRITTQPITWNVSGSACNPFVTALSICLNDYPGVMAEDYSGVAGRGGVGSRIQNNSWADIISVNGLNGGQYDADCVSFDTAVRDALLVGASNNVPGPSPLNQEYIVVFACNSLLGDAGEQSANGGYADIRVTAPATAKNVISVGSSINPRLETVLSAVVTQVFPGVEYLIPVDGSGAICDSQTNSLELYEKSAAGPTLDGRFKPEIVAPGVNVYGAISQIIPDNVTSTNCSWADAVPTYPYDTECTNPPCDGNAPLYLALYQCQSGSSFAAPAVSGSIQLLWWYFQHRLTNEVGNALLQPSPAMAKAYICNAARYMPIFYGLSSGNIVMDTLPSTLQGMGELDLQTMFDGVPRALRDESTPRAISEVLTATNPVPQQTYFSQSGQTYELSGQIATNGLPFRVTVAWTDPPGTPFAAQELVNNLDLEVTIGSGLNAVAYKGNVFSENVSVPGGAYDTVNNMESVFLNPTTMMNGIPGVTSGAPFQVTVRATDIAGPGVPNVGEALPGGTNVVNQDFALVVYNAKNVSDVPDITTNNSCATAIDITSYPFSFTNNLINSPIVSNNVYHQAFPSPTAGLGGPEEFFRIPLPTPGSTISIDTIGSSFDNVLSVWEVAVVPQTILVRGECGALTELTSSNIVNNGTFASQVSFVADGTNDYFVVVEPHNGGAGGQMVLNVKASAVPITLTPSSVTFSNQVIVGTTSAPLTVTYQNGTTVPVTINSISIMGPGSNDFVIEAQNCAGNTIGTGGSCAVVVGFAPTTNGTRQANLVFTDDAVGSPRIVPLIGNGAAPTPAVCLSSGTSFVFPGQVVGTTSTVQSLTITNCGSLPLVLSNATFTGTAAGDFSVAAAICTNAPLAAGGTCALPLTFIPTRSGTRQAILVIPDNAAGSPTDVNVQGVGLAPAPAVCVDSSLNLGTAAVGTTGAVQSLIITNCGTAPLVITSTSLSGETADFAVYTNTCGLNPIQTGDTCMVSVEFNPTAGGVRSATLSITSSNNVPSVQQVTLTGTGALSQPDAAISKSANNLKKFLGFGVINTTGVGQEISENVHGGAKNGVKYYIAVKNVGSGPDQFTVQSTQIDGGAGWTVNYYLGSKPSESVDITSAVMAGTYTTSTMGAGAVTSDSTMIRAEVFATKGIKKPTTATFTLTFTSISDPTQQDTVRITGVAK